MSREEKRLKHREVQRRFMKRKKEMLSDVKKSIGALEKQVAVLKLSSEQKILETENRTLQQEADTQKDVLVELLRSTCLRKSSKRSGGGKAATSTFYGAAVARHCVPNTS
ncbi:unnamed protein product [Peronospora belbahrii]|uniref:BZIP domain-containing protein n=1 Tax=Peronospora belbahrii TaxID=622444 RepID=A0AAU9KN79_9STRA|nr:unnamed protein product [Peronospora belbahrii]